MLANLLATFTGLLSLLGLMGGGGSATGIARPAAIDTELMRPASEFVDRDGASKPLPTAGSVDLARYAGTWYELARTPVRFQSPDSVSIARYEERTDGTVLVENTSYIGQERGYRIRGTAEPVGGRTDRLRVSFGGFLSVVPVADEGNYWVISVDDDYQLALVGTPDRRFLWLLARDGERYDVDAAQALLDRAARLGFDTDRLTLADWTTRTAQVA